MVGVPDGSDLVFTPKVGDVPGAPLSIRMHAGRAVVSATLGDTPQTDVRLVDNRLVASPPGYDCNFDDHALEIVGPTGLAVLHVFFLSPDHVSIDGCFVRGHRLIRIQSDGTRESSSEAPNLADVATNLFRYPSGEYPHKRWKRWSPNDDPRQGE